jgi:hypothetical protein
LEKKEERKKKKKGTFQGEIVSYTCKENRHGGNFEKKNERRKEKGYI